MKKNKENISECDTRLCKVKWNDLRDLFCRTVDSQNGSMDAVIIALINHAKENQRNTSTLVWLH
jgi:hypothetical protein